MEWYTFSEEEPDEYADVIVLREDKEEDQYVTFLAHYQPEDKSWHSSFSTIADQFVEIDIRTGVLSSDKWCVIKYPGDKEK